MHHMSNTHAHTFTLFLRSIGQTDRQTNRQVPWGGRRKQEMEGEDEEDVWRTPPWLYPCLLTLSAALLLYRSRTLSPPKDVKDKDIKSSSPFISLLLPAPFLFLQRRFLAFFFLASGKDQMISIIQYAYSLPLHSLFFFLSF